MTVRMRGLRTVLGSGIVGLGLYWLLFHFVPKATGSIRLPGAIALPLVGVVVGLVELATGLPFTRVDQAWTRLPRWIQVPLGFVISVALLVGIVLGFYFVLSR